MAMERNVPFQSPYPKPEPFRSTLHPREGGNEREGRVFGGFLEPSGMSENRIITILIGSSLLLAAIIVWMVILIHP